jgi:Macrocin-O-methyltransferase (TylF)/Glycosyltransferase WbsX
MASTSTPAATDGASPHPLVLAFYHPQFQPGPENDAWYGEGFTEWSLVAAAKPQFPGHRQPDLPGELGFYDLRVPQTREAQARVARAHGISGFVYLHYWFSGRELFEGPFNEVLGSGSPAFPFALCWANGDRRRTGTDDSGDVLLEQSHDEADDLAHVLRLIESFRDPRYLRIQGRPLLLVSSADQLPNPAATAELWRRECERAGVGAPWLVMSERDGDPTDPGQLGFDASVATLPQAKRTASPSFKEMQMAALDRPDPSWTRYPRVAPGWDTTPRHPDGGSVIWKESTPERYGQWLATALDRQRKAHGGAGIVFIEAWNDWASGAHLEPDTHWGRAYLHATKDVVARVAGVKPEAEETLGSESGTPATTEERYAELSSRYRDLQTSASGYVSYANRRLRATQEALEAELATSRDESRRLAGALTPLEDLLAMQTKRADELEGLLAGRPPLPAVSRLPAAVPPPAENGPDVPVAPNGSARYFELMKACLTRMLFMNDQPGRDPYELAQQRDVRMIGKDWPEDAETMVGMRRLDCIQECVETVIREDIPGDLLEAGVWRGGATIFMKSILAAYGVRDRRVWVADSFQGLPVPDEVNFPQDIPEDLSTFDELAVSQEQVKANFARYDLLDDQVRFLEGWFKDTLPTAPVESLAVLRLDGDYYESTIQILESLYHKVSPGGFVIVDDYGCIEACRQAVTDFRTANGIEDPIVKVDWTGVYWRRAAS